MAGEAGDLLASWSLSFKVEQLHLDFILSSLMSVANEFFGQTLAEFLNSQLRTKMRPHPCLSRSFPLAAHLSQSLKLHVLPFFASYHHINIMVQFPS